MGQYALRTFDVLCELSWRSDNVSPINSFVNIIVRPACMDRLRWQSGAMEVDGAQARAPIRLSFASTRALMTSLNGAAGGRNRAVGGFDFRHASGHVVEQHGGSGVGNFRSEITHTGNRIVAVGIRSSANYSQVEHPARIFRADWRWPAMMKSEAAALFPYLALFCILRPRASARAKPAPIRPLHATSSAAGQWPGCESGIRATRSRPSRRRSRAGSGPVRSRGPSWFSRDRAVP